MGVIMKTLCKIVIMLLFTCTRGENTQELEDITEMMRDMNTRLYKAEDQLARTKTELEETKTELVKTKIELAEAKTDLVTTKTDLGTTKYALNALAEKDNELESEITRMRNPPYMHACGAHYDRLGIKSATIPYSTPPPTQREEAWILLAGSSHLLTQDPTLSHGVYRLVIMLGNTL